MTILRRLLRRNGRLRPFGRLFTRTCMTPLVLLLAAAFVEAWMHRRRFDVSHPSHDVDEPFHTTCQEPAVDQPRENAALVMLTRNSELATALKSIQSIEKHFNRWFHYPFVFLNDEPWSHEFIHTMNSSVSGGARFEVIPKEEWSFPSWVDVDDARASIAKQGKAGILYAGLETYHHMCRFFSGKFYTLAALRQYKWYWRIEPDVDFYCSITYDPFVEMAKHKKIYGYTMALWEERATCPSLFRKVADWKEINKIRDTELWKATIAPSWVPWPIRSMLSWFRHYDRYGNGWSLCHYWSNFEIADLDWFRGKAYQDLFEYLDKSGGFYYERWGDAPVHSLALALLAQPERVHHFEDMGYRHDYFYQCPANAQGGQLLESKTLGDGEWAPEREGGIGCRCECDGANRSNYPSFCLQNLQQPNMAKDPGLIAWIRSYHA